MSTYKCLNCQKDLDIDLGTVNKIICPFCGYRILEKKRANILKKVMVR